MYFGRDKVCSIHPYFEIHERKLEDFKALCERFVAVTSQEEGCLYYGFSFDGLSVHCREAYQDAEAMVTHIGNVGSLLDEAFQIADLHRLEVHGPEEELAKLREPLAELSPQFFVLEYGIRA